MMARNCRIVPLKQSTMGLWTLCLLAAASAILPVSHAASSASASSSAAAAHELGTPAQGVVALTSSTFSLALHDAANPLWLLKFYAPWCGHCKKLAPVLQNVASQVTGKMAIGTIDCTIEKKLCNDHAIRGYPTLKFSLDGDLHEYPGGRNPSDFLQFAEKLSRFAIDECDSMDELTQVLAKAEDGVVFVAYHPLTSSHGDATTTQDKLQSTLLTQVYTQVARKEIAYGSFVLANAGLAESLRDSSETPFVCRVEDGVQTRCYDKPDRVDLDDLLRFVRENNIPTVARLGSQNFHKVGRRGKPLIIAVIDPEQTEQLHTAKRELARYALEGPEAVRQKYYYGYIDGKAFQKFLLQFDLVPEGSPQIFALDVPSRTYWQNATYKLNVDDFVAAVQDKTIRSKNAGKKGLEGVWMKVYHAFIEYRPWSVVLAVVVVFTLGVVVLSLIFPGDELRPPYPPGEAPGTEAPPRRTAPAVAPPPAPKQEASQGDEPTESKKAK